MTNLVESAAFLLLLIIAFAAMIRFPARRYLLILVTASALGAWLMGYAAGYRASAESLDPFLDGSRVQQARAMIEAARPSALWGLSFCALIIIADILAFGVDVRKNSKNRREAGHTSEDHGK